MGRMYTLDGKLLCGSPEIRIGDKVYPVDDRTSTVKKALSMFRESDTGEGELDRYDKLFALAFGKNAKEISDMDMPFPAYQRLAESVIALMTGAEPDGDFFRQENAENECGGMVRP